MARTAKGGGRSSTGDEPVDEHAPALWRGSRAVCLVVTHS
ncbi:hypothetical protein HMPREF0183_0328 [Brevibacterium mcbrellneri ATCC 49030]|uniref:Uncharacterized protein n=1 Tax=Brevibacterium mcbrellneri ATCC 49030 TaxID=585530 RepID=D4YK68_9MICO|nr:hypothetical protein HMPREF0183_0328 [Brevibacterium mcbrellneri ATCC 49030]